MSIPTLGTLHSLPAVDHPELVAVPVAAALRDLGARRARSRSSRSTPTLADTAAMTEAYDLPLTASANCVVVAGRRDGEERVAACVVRADTRADVNNLVKRTLDVRKASFLPMDRAVEESGMEYGGITPLGLPASLAAAGGRPGRSTSTSRSSAPAYAAPSCCCPAGCSPSCPGPRSSRASAPEVGHVCPTTVQTVPHERSEPQGGR